MGERYACPKCYMPVVFITAEYRNARLERRHRMEARHHKSIKKDERDQIINSSTITPKYARELLRKLAAICKPMGIK